PKGLTLASGCMDRSVHLLDPISLSLRSQFFNHADAVTSLSWAPDGKTLAGGSMDRTVRLWPSSAPPPHMTAILGDHVGQVWFALHSPDGKLLATGGDDGKVQIRRTEGARLSPFLQGAVNNGITTFAYSPDGKTLATGSNNAAIQLWDVATAKQKKLLRGHNQPVLSLSFSPDGKFLASASGKWQDREQPGEVKVWDLTSDKEIKEVLDVPGHNTLVTRVAYSPDGQTLVSCTWDGAVRLLEAATGKER